VSFKIRDLILVKVTKKFQFQIAKFNYKWNK
jgi:hypothetical protein